MLGLVGWEGAVCPPPLPHIASPAASTETEPLQLHGRDADVERMVRRVLNPCSWRPVISLVGAAGAGKTAVAHAVFKDPRVAGHFSRRVWLHLRPDVLPTTCRIAVQIGGEDHPRGGRRCRLRDLRNCFAGEGVEGARSLIVLDDAWLEDREALCPQLAEMKCAVGEGSVFVLTTRSFAVAEELSGISGTETVAPLSDDDSLLIFQDHAFPEGDRGEHPFLDRAGRKIVLCLGGNPLAVKAAGEALSLSREPEMWDKLSRNEELWKSIEKFFLPTLLHDYEQLPPTSQQCFNFCSAFPRRYMFDKSALVQMLVAQDLVETRSRRNMSLEEAGSSCFEDLVRAGFFQKVSDDLYMMYDFVFQLSRLFSDNCSMLGLEEPNYGQEMAHQVKLSHRSRIDTLKRLWTLKCVQGLSELCIRAFCNNHFTRACHLRVLDLSGSGMSDLPDAIRNMKYLRYLDLSYNAISVLPESVGTLLNLQTFKLKERSPRLLTHLPQSLCKLKNLRHLEIDNELLSQLNGLGDLSFLQELWGFIVYRHHNEKLLELNSMKELRTLHIRGLENIDRIECVRQINMVDKSLLEKLRLEWEWGSSANLGHKRMDEHVLECLSPPLHLKCLEIIGNRGLRSPSWMTGQDILMSLQHLSLHHCSYWCSLPSLGSLPLLKSLEIIGMDRLTDVDNRFYDRSTYDSFRSLERLRFSEMREWTTWSGAEHPRSLFPVLQILEIKDCPKLEKLPCLPSSLIELKLLDVGLLDLPIHRTPSSLSSLHIISCQNLGSLHREALHQFVALTTLSVQRCEKLTVLALDVLITLKYLRIEGCPNLIFTNSPVPLLNSLATDNRLLLSWFLPKNMVFLKLLEIEGCTELTSFTTGEEMGLFSLNSLRKLHIWDCQNLSVLPSNLSALSSLEQLDIRACPNIKSFPVEGLPKLLQKLRIVGCQMLLQSLGTNKICELGNVINHMTIN